jgi:hypothetical protein
LRKKLQLLYSTHHRSFFQVALTAALWGGIFVALNKQERKQMKMKQHAAEEHVAAAARGESICVEKVK